MIKPHLAFFVEMLSLSLCTSSAKATLGLHDRIDIWLYGRAKLGQRLGDRRGPWWTSARLANFLTASHCWVVDAVLMLQAQMIVQGSLVVGQVGKRRAHYVCAAQNMRAQANTYLV